MSYSVETRGIPQREVVVIGGQQIEIINIAGEGLAETVSQLRKLNLSSPNETPDLPEAA